MLRALKTSSADLGDFQTPPELVSAVLDRLGPSGPLEIKAFEVQEARLAVARKVVGDTRYAVELKRADIFDVDLRRLQWNSTGPLLVIGNPPWVTTSALGAMGSTNMPRKRNVLSLRGIDALTGSSNFDLTEHVWWKLLTELSEQQPTIALLSKTSVARRVMVLARRLRIPVSNARMFRIDARKWFGASVDACLFTLSVRGEPDSYEAAVYESLESARPSSTMGFVGEHLVGDLSKISAHDIADGTSRLQWRQGVKHDVAAVMELAGTGDRYRNRLGEDVEIESEVIYPLLKGSDLNRRSHDRRLAVIVTQQSLSDDAGRLAEIAPRAWEYLTRHADLFKRRRSTIYRGRADFAMFGIGPYSFSRFKVAIAGLYREPRFRLLGPLDGKPVMLDDTCYFLAVENPAEGALICAVLNAPETRQLITALSFPDSKRPITKRLLQKVDPLSALRRQGVRTFASAADAELVEAGQAPLQVSWEWTAERLLTATARPELTFA